MFVQDTQASVEVVVVPRKDKDADRRMRRARDLHMEVLKARLDARLFQEALAAMEQAVASAEPVDSGRLARRGRSGAPSERDLKSMRAGLERARTKVAKTSERVQALEDEIRALDGADRVTRSYRLHVEGQKVEWSEPALRLLTSTQRAQPVHVATNGRVRWWWHLERFWREDEGLGAEDVGARVLAEDRKNRRRQQRALDAALGPEHEPAEHDAHPSHGAGGRRIDNGSRMDVAQRSRPPAVAENDARSAVDGTKRPWRHAELLPSNGDRGDAEAVVPEGGADDLSEIWVVSPEDVGARRSA